MPKLVALTMTIAAAAALASASQAGAPAHLRAPLHISAPSPEYSAACGFPVVVSADGTLDVKIHAAPTGSVCEQDAFPGLTITVSAPSTGRSFQHVFGPTTYLYPSGLHVGAPVVITSLGVRGDAPGIPPDAGRIVTPAVVVAIDPDIGPIPLPTGPPVSQSGNFEDPPAIVDAICAALAG